MRRCYRGVALALGGILTTSLTSFNSCSYGTLTVYAAEDSLTEELETAFQEEVQAGEENVETDIPEEEAVKQLMEETTPEEIVPKEAEETVEEEMPEEANEEKTAEQPNEENLTDETIQEPDTTEVVEEPTIEESASEPEQVVGSSIALERPEYEVLLKIVEAEAGGEDSTGKLLVANVVINRVRSSHFPNTVSGVVYQKSGGTAQFSPIADGRIDRVSISSETVEAVARAMNGEDISAGALYFRAVNSNSNWFDQSLNRVLEHGNHIFYAM